MTGLIAWMGTGMRGPDGAVRANGVCGGVQAESPGGAVQACIVGRPRWTRADLAALDATAGPAVTLLEAWRQYRDGLFDHLAGDYALVLLDRRGEPVLLAGVDRFAIRSLCFARPRGGGVVVAARTDDVLTHPLVPDTLSPQALYEFLLHYTVRAPLSAHGAVTRLGPAEYLLARGGDVRLARHWMPAWGDGGGDHADPEVLRELLRSAVSRALPAGGVGCFLSGGLDSSTVTGFAVAERDGLTAFTIGFDDPRFDERPFARLAARHFQVALEEAVLTPGDAADLLPDMAAAFDEPFGNSSAVAVLACARLARRRGVTRLLAGDGGDEIFAGNARYRERLRDGLLARLVPPLPGVGPLGRLNRRAERARAPYPAWLEGYHPLRGLAPADLLADGLAEEVDGEAPLRHALAIHDAPVGAAPVQRMMHLDLSIALADNDLRKVGEMCALAGVEVAFPMLDDALVDFALRIPPRLQATPRTLRGFFKQAMAGLLPPAIIAKRKHGFGLPFGPWTRTPGPVREVVREALDGLSRRGLLNSAFLVAVMDGPSGADQPDVSDAAWDLACLELWLRSRRDRQGRKDAVA